MGRSLRVVPAFPMLALLLATPAALRRTLDAQQYLSSGDIGDTYLPHLGTTAPRSGGARVRRDFVLLAGVSWRAD